WNKSTYNNINFKHLDCNGDGNIDAADKFVVEDNYGKTRTSTFQDKSAEQSNSSIYFSFEKDTFYAGEMVTATLNLGTKNNPFSNAYGAAYQYSYSANHAMVNTINFRPLCDALCSDGSFVLQTIRNFPNIQIAETSQVRTDKNNVTTANKLGEFSFLLEDSTHYYNEIGDWIYLKLLHTKIIDKTGKEFELKNINDSAIVIKRKTDPTVGIKQNQSIFSDVHIWPNPAQNIINIETGNNFSGEILITNILGQQMQKCIVQNQKSKMIDTKHFPAGIYMVAIKSGSKISTQKLIIAR
ncbi:MAG: T9SS type A sorting domain-containing protein, partial [Flavobacterium sp.]